MDICKSLMLPVDNTMEAFSENKRFQCTREGTRLSSWNRLIFKTSHQTNI